MMRAAPANGNSPHRKDITLSTGFSTGFASLQKSIDEAKARNSFSGNRLSFISWKSGDRKIVRFLTNDVITATTYSFVTTVDGKSQGFLVDPDKGDFVQKYASATPGGPGWQINYGTKQPEFPKGREQTFALAVMRDMVPKSGGGFDVVDATTSTEYQGKSYNARTFGIIQQGLGNFWGSLKGCHDVYGTICDRDYVILREGGDKDTRYVITPLDPVEELKDLATLQATYGYGAPRDKEDPERFMFCPQTLAEWADEYSGEERARRLLVPGGGPAQPVPAAAPAAAPQFAPTTVAPVASAPVASSGLGEFHPATTHNPDEAQAAPPVVAPSTATNFSSIRDTLMAPKQ